MICNPCLLKQFHLTSLTGKDQYLPSLLHSDLTVKRAKCLHQALFIIHVKCLIKNDRHGLFFGHSLSDCKAECQIDLF